MPSKKQPLRNMPANFKGRSLLTLKEFSSREIARFIDLAIECKRQKRARIFPRRLENRNICGIFLKPSGRTSAAFVVAAYDEGAHLQFFPAEDVRFGVKESVKDLARVLGRVFDGIAFRGYAHSVAEELAANAGVPVWNGLTDEHHPTQVLADLMTFKEEFGRFDGISVAYIGDGRNNMVASLAIGALKMGYHLRVVAPRELQPGPAMRAAIYEGIESPLGTVTTTDKVADVKGCDVIYTDVWISMGESVDMGERIRLLTPYKVNAAMLERTGKPGTIFMHCLPALHDLGTELARAHPDLIEVDDDVFEGPKSRVFDQGENRMHTIKAVMIETI
jgi:ornithine carbamoyltransferase